MTSPRNRFVLRGMLGYAIFASLWIVLSDLLLEGIADPARFIGFSMVKGLAFVAVTSVPLYVVLRGSTPVEDEAGGRWSLSGVFAVMAVGIAAIGLASFHILSGAMRHDQLGQLEGVAQLKVEGVSSWLAERRADIGNVTGNPETRSALARWLRTGDSAAGEHVLHSMEALRFTHRDVVHVSVLSPDGRHLLGVDDKDDDGDPELIDRAVRDVASSRGMVFLDLHIQRSDGSVHMGYLAPFMDPARPGRVLAVAMVEMDPRLFLFPFVGSWHLAAVTGETLLARRDGDDVVFLSELRHWKADPLGLRLPANRAGLPAASALAGRSGAMEGEDYRGVPVLAAALAVPETPWVLVAKVDEAEVMDGIRRLATVTAILVLMTLALAAAALGYLWHRQQLRRVRAELMSVRALDQANERHRSLFDNMLDACTYCWMVFEEGEPSDFIFLSVNEAFETVTGLKDAAGRRASEVLPGIHDRDRALLDVCGRVALDGKPERLELHVETLGKWLSLSLYCPKPEHFVAVFADITPRRRDEEARRESEDRLRLAQEAAEIGTWDWISGSDSVVWSPETYRHHGLDPGRGPSSFADWVATLHPDDRDRAIMQIGKALEESGVYESEYRVVWPDGQVRWLAGRGRIIRDPASGDVARMIGISRDLTEQRAAQQAVLRARTEVLHAARLTAIGEVASTIAHEVNQPIGAASNYVHTARILSPDGRINELLDQGIDQMQKAATIISKVREFAANRRHDRQAEAIGPLIRDACFLGLMGDAAHRIGLTMDVPDDLPDVLVDRVQIEQVLVNVIRNAADALHDTEQPSLRISAFLAANGTMLDVVVADNGPGIAEEIRPRLFQPFMTTKPDGTGLGLSTSLTIMRSHGGNLWVEAGSGGGAVFRMSIPIEEDADG